MTMMTRLLGAVLLVAASVAPAMAQEDGAFSANSEARSWNLWAEEKARFEAKVVDILCELTGDCADNCGDGRRQLGLVRTVDDVLVLVNKNSQPLFTGGAEELLPYCGETVEVDGLLVGDVSLTPAPVYLIQLIRRPGEEEWTRANRWTKVWAEKNPDSAGSGPWFRRDKRVNGLIARDGYLGLGQEIDQAFIEEWF